MIELFEALFVVSIGLCLGSFLNVVIVRLPRGKSLISPGSRCGFCRSALKWYTNIPLLGFLRSGGSCSKCGVRYSSRYFWVELLTAALFLGLWSVHGWSQLTVLYCIFAAAIIAMSFIDIEFRIIPDAISLGGCAVALILSALSVPDYPLTLVESIVGVAIGYGLFWVLSRSFYFLTQEVGLGEGDLKLMAFIGAVVGIKGVITTVLVGSILGTLVGLISLFILKKSRRFPIPFGPFLGMGALVHVMRLDFWW